MIGNNTAGTLIGAAGGALAGAIAGNAMDQNETNKRLESVERQLAAAPSINTQDQPPGKWVEIPGQWVDGKWMPAPPCMGPCKSKHIHSQVVYSVLFWNLNYTYPTC